MNGYNYVVYSRSKSHTASPSFVHIGEVPEEGFISLYAVTAETAEAIFQTGTTAQFKGVVWCPFLYIDTDTADESRATESKLKELGYAFNYYNSGRDGGAHFELPRDNTPSHLLPAQDKAWVQRVAPWADTSIYTHLHLFRLPGTVHESTNRKKQLVYQYPGTVLVVPPIERATVQATTAPVASSSTGVFSNFLVMAGSMPAKPGNRHASLVKLAFTLKDSSGLSPEMCLWWLHEVNKGYPEPKSEEAVDQIFKTVFQR